jgi:tRNA (guanine-N7-)-methyltransferase
MTERPDPHAWTLDLAGKIPPLSWEDVFTFSPAGVEIEIGSGKGLFLRRRAAARPDSGFVGVERAGKWLRLSAERIARDARPNIRVIRTDAFDLLARWVPLGSVAAIHVYFPDPWPKKRHAKRRLLGPALFDLSARALAAGGRLAIATDVVAYFEEANGILLEHACFEEMPVTDADRDEVRTNYALKYEREGRGFRFACYRRNLSAPPLVPPPPTRRSLRGDTAPTRGGDAGP